MRRCAFLAALAAVLALALPSTSPAQGWYIGGGLENVRLGGDLNGITDHPGFALDFGLRMSPFVALDCVTGSSIHDASGVGLTYSHLTLGPKFSFPNPSTVRPYVTAGLAWHEIVFDSTYLDMSGWGYFAGAGVEGHIAPMMTLGLDARWHAWDGESGGTRYDNESVIWSLLLNFGM